MKKPISRVKKQVFFVIHKTPYQDFDVLALGADKPLKLLSTKYGEYYKPYSNIYEMPILLMGTFDKVNEAVKFIDSFISVNTQKGVLQGIVRNNAKGCMK